MALLLTDTQKVTFSIQPVDAKGAPAKVDGAPVWTVTDPTVGVITPAADGLSAEFVAGLPGVCQVAVSADADLGEGIVTIQSTADVQVEGGQAVSLPVTAGVPEAQ